MLDIQDSPASSTCEKDWLEIGGVKWVSCYSWLENSWLKRPYTSCGSTCTRFIIHPLRIMSDGFAELLAYLCACVCFSYASTDSVTQLGTAAERGSTLHPSCCTFTQTSLWPIKVFIWSTEPSLLKAVSLLCGFSKSILKWDYFSYFVKLNFCFVSWIRIFLTDITMWSGPKVNNLVVRQIII